ncbi:ABC transporter permease [Terrisporobacter petrolearius]|uniref:ABC transporter permease n=1 Tax=Terrisporobacter petrolearius TaxID=1460447 RepID=UPI003EBBCB8B
MIVLIKLIINTMRALMKDKSYIMLAIIIPIFIAIFFSFEFTGKHKFKVGVIDNDNSYVSNEIIKTIDDLEGIQSIIIKEEDSEILLITQQIQLVVIINDNFQNKLINSKDNEIEVKTINENHVKLVVQNMIDMKCEDLSMIGKMSKGDINKFKEINQDYNDKNTILSLNDVNEKRPDIESSLGLIILTVFILAGKVSNFLIEDKDNKVRIKTLGYEISKWKYYLSIIVGFYIMSSMATLIYYGVLIIFKSNFAMDYSINFLVVMMLLNLVALSFNLCLVSFTRSRHISSMLNVLIIIPCCMLSGVFWDFNIMPEKFQEIGRLMPTRWICICLENLQQTNDLGSINIYLNAMLILSIILFVISFAKLKENK